MGATTICPIPGCPNDNPCLEHPQHRGWAWRQLRAQALHRDHNTCWCGQPATTVHHILPLAAGGRDKLANLRSLCAAHHHTMHRPTQRVDN